MRKVALTLACRHAHGHVGMPITRRGFIGQAVQISMTTAAASTLLEAYAARALAAQARAIKFSHGSGLCNMPLFYAAEKISSRSMPSKASL